MLVHIKSDGEEIKYEEAEKLLPKVIHPPPSPAGYRQVKEAVNKEAGHRTVHKAALWRGLCRLS